MATQHGDLIEGINYLTAPRDEYTRTNTQEFCQTTFRCAYPFAAEILPERNTAHPTFTDTKLKRCVVKQDPKFGTQADVTLFYETPAGGSTYAPIPDTKYSCNVAGEIVDVTGVIGFFDETTPFPEAWKVWEYVDGVKTFKTWSDEAPANVRRMGRNYRAARVEVTKTTYSLLPFRDATSKINTCALPGGGWGGAAKNWLILTASESEEGIFYTQTLVYLYSVEGWPALYPGGVNSAV